jgi:hypothetical protein
MTYLGLGTGRPDIYRQEMPSIRVHSRGPVIWYQASPGSGGSQGLPWMASRMASSALMPRASAESRWLRSLAPAGEGGQAALHGRIKLWMRRPKSNCVLSAGS